MQGDMLLNYDRTISVIDSFPDVDGIEFIKDNYILKHGSFAGVPQNDLRQIIAAKNRLVQDNDLLQFLWHSVQFVYNLENASARREAIPDLAATVPDLYPVFFFLLVLAGIPKMLSLYEHAGWPLQTAKDTLQDINIWLQHSKKEFGIVGLTHHNFCWLMGLLDGSTIRLGRLQFQKLEFNRDITVFRHRMSGEIEILCGDGVRYNGQGLIDGIGGKWDEDGYWLSSFKQSDNKVIGNPISKAGFAEKLLVELDLDEWEDVLHRGDKTINIHIPAGAPLEPDMCRESFGMAKVFFRKHFPDYKFKALVCFSWFLDNQLENILGRESNVVKFQHLGRIFPLAGESAAVKRIFGHKAVECGVNSVPHKTSMQRAVAEFINSGGILRNGGLVIIDAK